MKLTPPLSYLQNSSYHFHITIAQNLIALRRHSKKIEYVQYYLIVIDFLHQIYTVLENGKTTTTTSFRSHLPDAIAQSAISKCSSATILQRTATTVVDNSNSHCCYPLVCAIVWNNRPLLCMVYHNKHISCSYYRCLLSCTGRWTRFVDATMSIVSRMRYHSTGLRDDH